MNFKDLDTLLEGLLCVVRHYRANPFVITNLVKLPRMAQRLMASRMQSDGCAARVHARLRRQSQPGVHHACRRRKLVARRTRVSRVNDMISDIFWHDLQLCSTMLQLSRFPR